MSIFDQLSKSRSIDNVKAVFTFKDISAKTQDHLRKVYTNVAVCTAICGVASFMNQTFILSGFIAQFLSIIAMGYMAYKISNVYESEESRGYYLYGFSFFVGFLLGPMINMLLEFEPEIIYQALGMTAVIFGSFSMVALFSKRRSYLFLGGIISSIVSCMFWYRWVSWMLGGSG